MHPIYIALFPLFFLCQENAVRLTDFAYNLDYPDKIYFMPDALKEISGIQCKDENTLVCIEDNGGVFYFYDTERKEVAEKLVFEAKGDFEDLAIVNKVYYALRSNGWIYKIYSTTKKTKHKTKLNRRNNPEGLCFDPKKNRLLIACKDDGGSGLTKYEKGIYSFSLQENKLSEAPAIIIDIHELAKKNSDKHLSDFSPSGIAINPINNHLFVISSKGKLLLELNEGGVILFVKKLSKKLFSQPEGICFSPSGDLIISNEGKKGGGTILRFKSK